MSRRKYRNGCLFRERRKTGPNVWALRWRDGAVNRKEIIGTVEQFPTKSDALKACEPLRATMNRGNQSPRTFAELVTHYTEKELPEDGSNKSYSTRKTYRGYLKNRIVPAWGGHRLSAIKTVAVEDWLRTLPLAPGTKAKLRNIMSALFTHAMRHELTDRNPIKLVRQSAKRQSTPEVLTAEELRALLSELDGPYYAMAFMAAVTGLRVSELLALKWADLDFTAREIRLRRAVVCQHIGALKTETSQKPVPLDTALADALLDWRGHCPYNQDSDYVFASAEKHGTQPLWPSSAMSKHIRPAAQRAGIVKHVRWHVFRHSFATLLNGNGENVKTVQESLRHADSKVTLDTYTQGLMPVKRAAQKKVSQMIVPIRSQTPGTAAAIA
jgi:integrase